MSFVWRLIQLSSNLMSLLLKRPNFRNNTAPLLPNTRPKSKNTPSKLGPFNSTINGTPYQTLAIEAIAIRPLWDKNKSKSSPWKTRMKNSTKLSPKKNPSCRKSQSNWSPNPTKSKDSKSLALKMRMKKFINSRSSNKVIRGKLKS